MATDPSSAPPLDGDRTVDPTDRQSDDATVDSTAWPSDVTAVDLIDRDRVRTTIDLERVRNEDDVAAWTATQYEVPIVGRGATAPEAAADYCRRIAARAARTG